MADGVGRTTEGRRVTRSRDLGGICVLDRFQLRRELSRGAGVDLWLGREIGSRRLVTVKVVGPDEAERAQVEAEAMAGLGEHRHVARLVDHGPVVLPGSLREQGYCMVLEHLEGVPLQTVLQVTTPRAPRAIAWMAQLADALAHCHAQGVVHGQVGADQVLVSRDARGRERLVLFGLGTTDGATGAVQRALTMSPEQASGDPATEASDLYALGALLYRMLVESYPFTGAADAIAMAHQHEQIPPLGQFAPLLRLPPGLEQLVVACLEKRPDERLGSVAELRDGLVALQYSPQRDWVRVTGLDLTLPPDDDTEEAAPPRVHGLMGPGVGVVAVVVLVVSAWMLLG